MKASHAEAAPGSGAPAPRSPAYLASLDGIRALAIVLVVMFHSLPDVRGGYIGVEIFFTLSGFLITLLLLGEIGATGSIDRGAFYARRALRLLPALGVLVVLSVVLVGLTGGNNGGLPLSRSVPPVLLYFGNWVEAAGLGLGYMSHTWSLAIEEQFYLLWPLLLVTLARRRDAATVLVVATIGLVLFRAMLTPLAPSTPNLSVWTTSKADCLLVGAILAIVLARDPARVERLAASPRVGVGALAGLAGILVFLSAVASPYTWSDYGLTTGVAIATAALIAHVVVRPGGRVAAPLGWKPVAAIGRVSYGIYLYHWPITVWVGRFSLPLAVRAGAVYALTAVAVVASWFLVERPALRLKRRFARPRVEAQVMAAPSATQVKGALVHPMATGARQLPMAVADDGAE